MPSSQVRATAALAPLKRCGSLANVRSVSSAVSGVLSSVDELGLGQHLLAPALPERQAGARGAVLGLVRRQREQQLRVLEQLRDLLIPLVPELLGNGLVERVFAAEPARSLALDHRERNAIDEQHGIRPPGLGRSERLHRELVGHVVDVALRVLPVDELQLEALRVALHRLRHALAEPQQLPHLLVGAHEPVIARIRERTNALPDRRRVELVRLAAILKLVDRRELLLEHGPQHHLAFLAAPQLQRLRRREQLPAQLLQQVQCRQLRHRVFGEWRGGVGDGGHDGTAREPERSLERRARLLSVDQLVQLLRVDRFPDRRGSSTSAMRVCSSIVRESACWIRDEIRSNVDCTRTLDVHPARLDETGPIRRVAQRTTNSGSRDVRRGSRTRRNRADEIVRPTRDARPANFERRYGSPHTLRLYGERRLVPSRSRVRSCPWRRTARASRMDRRADALLTTP